MNPAIMLRTSGYFQTALSQTSAGTSPCREMDHSKPPQSYPHLFCHVSDLR